MNKRFVQNQSFDLSAADVKVMSTIAIETEPSSVHPCAIVIYLFVTPAAYASGYMLKDLPGLFKS